MLLTDMVIYAVDPAFHDGKISFDCVCVNIAANVFASTVIDGVVSLKHPS